MMSPQHVGIALMANPVLAVLLTGLFIAVMAGLNLRGRESASVRRHRRYRAAAARVLQRLPQLGGNGQRLAYLRKINPYVFEELLLLAFERQGYAVIRNTSYSGDGGLDGQVIIGDQKYLIQAKRYGRAITQSHITRFGALLRHHHCQGFHSYRPYRPAEPCFAAEPSSRSSGQWPEAAGVACRQCGVVVISAWEHGNQTECLKCFISLIMLLWLSTFCLRFSESCWSGLALCWLL